MDSMLSRLAPASEWDAPSNTYTFFQSPIAFIARRLYKLVHHLRPAPPIPAHPIRVVCISDTHTQTTEIPDGDLLIHAGDLTNKGTIEELQKQIDWLHNLPHQHKVAIAGNHDTYLDPRSRGTLSDADRNGSLDWKSIHYLQHSSVHLIFPNRSRRLRIYGAPQTPACGGPEFAFQYERGQDVWADTVPADIDVLVTHTPPKWHLDLPIGLGCEHLLPESWRVQPKIHVFGHIHAGSGSEILRWDAAQAACERILTRSSVDFFGFLKLANWFDVARICLFGIRDIIWNTSLGGEAYGGILINAALMNQVTGQLDNTSQVVDI